MQLIQPTSAEIAAATAAATEAREKAEEEAAAATTISSTATATAPDFSSPFSNIITRFAPAHPADSADPAVPLPSAAAGSATAAAADAVAVAGAPAPSTDTMSVLGTPLVTAPPLPPSSRVAAFRSHSARLCGKSFSCFRFYFYRSLHTTNHLTIINALATAN
jgi:hypothetical protein